MRDHTKLRAFELADEVAVLIYRATRGFPKEEIYGLTSQILHRLIGYRLFVKGVSECGAKMMETEKVLSRLDSVHAQRLTAFSLQPKHLSSYSES